MKRFAHSPMMRFLALCLAMLMLIGTLAACHEFGPDGWPTIPPETSAGDPATDEPTDVPGTNEATEIPTEEATDPSTEEVTTEDPATRVNEPADPAFLTFYENKRNRNYFSGANQCSFENEQQGHKLCVGKTIQRGF